MIHRGWISKIARRLLRRRKFHAFNVGAGRTGTVSIHAMFSAYYVSMHEPEAHILIPLIIENEGKADRRPFRDYVWDKDRRLINDAANVHCGAIMKTLYPDSEVTVEAFLHF